VAAGPRVVNSRAPVSLRVKIDRDTFTECLTAHGVRFETSSNPSQDSRANKDDNGVSGRRDGK
jgi:hypothetical protein